MREGAGWETLSKQRRKAIVPAIQPIQFDGKPALLVRIVYYAARTVGSTYAGAKELIWKKNELGAWKCFSTSWEIYWNLSSKR